MRANLSVKTHLREISGWFSLIRPWSGPRTPSPRGRHSYTYIIMNPGFCKAIFEKRAADFTISNPFVHLILWSYQTVRLLRPFARRRAMTLRPFLVAMRFRKPWTRLRWRFLGWKVRFIFHSSCWNPGMGCLLRASPIHWGSLAELDYTRFTPTLSRGSGQNFSLPRQRIGATESYPLHFVLFTVENCICCGKLLFFFAPRKNFQQFRHIKKFLLYYI